MLSIDNDWEAVVDGGGGRRASELCYDLGFRERTAEKTPGVFLVRIWLQEEMLIQRLVIVSNTQ